MIVMDGHIDQYIKRLLDKPSTTAPRGTIDTRARSAVVKRSKGIVSPSDLPSKNPKDLDLMPILTKLICKGNDLRAIAGDTCIDEDTKVVFTVFFKLGGSFDGLA